MSETVVTSDSFTGDFYWSTVTVAGVYTVAIPNFQFADGAIARIIPDTSGLLYVNINGIADFKIYGSFPLYAGYSYELVYRSSGGAFFANKTQYCYVPTSSDDFTVPWASIGSDVASIVAANRANSAWSVFDTYVTLANPSGVVGGCPRLTMLPDGRIFCTPFNSTFAKIFTPGTDTFSSVGSFTGSTAYSSSVLLPSGKVLMIPLNGANNPLKIFDPGDYSFANLTSAVGNYCGDACVLPSGKVLITSGYTGTTTYCLDPIADTITTPGGSWFSASQYKSCPCLAPDGKVYQFTYNSTAYKQYDPTTNTWTALVASNGINGIGNALIMSDGRLWTANSGNGIPYALDTNGQTQSAVGLTYTYHFSGNILLPDGRIFSTHIGVQLRVHDPISQSVATPVNLPLTDTNYVNDRITRQPMLLRDGRILVSTYNNTQWYIYSNANAQVNFTNGMLASRTFNR